MAAAAAVTTLKVGGRARSTVVSERHFGKAAHIFMVSPLFAFFFKFNNRVEPAMGCVGDVCFYSKSNES